MNDTVVNLLGLYAGLLLMNTLISLFMWLVARHPLSRDLVVLWGAMLFAFIAQGVTGGAFAGNHLGIVMGFSTLFLANLAYANLLTRLTGAKIPWAASLGLFAAGTAATVAAFVAGFGFTVVAMPMAIGVVFPALFTASRSLVTEWNRLTVSARALNVACILITLHELDYPFFRHLDDYAAMGFTIAIIVVFAMSIFAPAVALESATAMQARADAEIEVAHRIQTAVVPRKPELPGFELACHMKPAEKIGGDYYDVYNIDGYSWILIGDVTGHGLSSGLVMLMAQSILASIVHTRSGISPSELTFLANRVLYQNLKRLDELRSMTIVALCRVGDERRFVYSGNHDHVFVYRAADRTVDVVSVANLPHDLGFMNEFPRSDYGESSFTLDPGDVMLLATDGIVEAAHNGRYTQGMYESDRLCALLKSMADRPLEDIKARILADLEDFTGGMFHDDVTFVLARPIQ